MPISCTRCLRTLPGTDGAGPLFCTFCGQKLRTDNAGPPEEPIRIRHLDRSASLLPFDVDVDFDSPFDPASTHVGGYRLLRRIGAGGMGTVYEAISADGTQRVAMKLLASRMESNPVLLERFHLEGKLASRIRHPRCVFAVAADTEDGRPYIVMELMPGRTLRDLVNERGPMSVREAVTRILDVIEGLAEAHRLGVIHRDVKPSNCFLTADDRVKIGDFGLSKSLAGPPDSHLLRSEAFLGTVLFAPPEQIRGEPVDFAADVYAVCATLYYLICGEAPHHHESMNVALAQALTEDAPPIRTKRPDTPEALEQILMKGLERHADRRWRSLTELRDVLQVWSTRSAIR